MPDTRLYHGALMVYDVESGDEVNVAIQVAISSRRLAYTIKPLAGDTPEPVTLTSTDPAEFALLQELLDRMHQVCATA